MNIRERIIGLGWRGLGMTGAVAAGGVLLAARPLMLDGGTVRLWAAMGAGGLLLAAVTEVLRRKHIRYEHRRTEPVFERETTTLTQVAHERSGEDGTMIRNMLFFAAVLMAFLYFSFL